MLGLPVNLWIVLFQPSKTQDDILFPQAGNRKGSPLCVIFITENCVYYFCDGACLISGSVYIENRNSSGEVLSHEAVPSDKTYIHELAGSSAID